MITRFALRLFLVLLIAAPSLTFADVPKCFMSLSADPSGSKSFDLLKESAQYKVYMQNSLLCPSACFDEVVTLTFANTVVKVTVAATNKCAPQAATKEVATTLNRGCTKGQAQPAVKVNLVNSSQKPPAVKTRCDAEAITNATQGGDTAANAVQNLKLRLTATNALAQDIAVGTVQGNTQLSQALQNLGASKDEADAAVQQDSQKALELLQKSVAGDGETAQKIATDLNLNENLKDRVANLNPLDFKDVLSGAVSDTHEQQLDAMSAPETGFQPPPTTEAPSSAPLALQGANDQIRTVASSVCQQFSVQNCKGFGNNMIATFYQECGGKPNCMGHGSSYAGSFALSSEEYAKGIQAYVSTCDQSSDACQQVMQNCSGDGRGNHMCNTAAAVANHAVIQAGIEAATSNPYQQAAIHMMYQLMPTQTVGALTSGDPSAIWNMQLSGDSLKALCSNKVCLAGGATGADAMHGILANYRTLAQGVSVATNGLAGPVPYGPYAASPFGGGSTLYGNPYAGSPFASVTPVGYSTGAYGSYNGVPVSTGSPVPTGSTVSTGSTVPTGSNVSTGSTPPGGSAQPAPVTPVATLLVQPQSVFTNNPLSISWSSVGMRTGAPCILSVATSTAAVPLAQGNEGSKTIYPKTAGEWKFHLSCTGQNGASLSRDASATVQ